MPVSCASRPLEPDLWLGIYPDPYLDRPLALAVPPNPQIGIMLLELTVWLGGICLLHCIGYDSVILVPKCHRKTALARSRGAVCMR